MKDSRNMQAWAEPARLAVTPSYHAEHPGSDLALLAIAGGLFAAALLSVRLATRVSPVVAAEAR